MNTDVDPEVSRSTLSRLLYEVPLARWDSMMLSKCRLKESRLLSEGRRGLPMETGDLRLLWASDDASNVLLEKRTMIFMDRFHPTGTGRETSQI